MAVQKVFLIALVTLLAHSTASAENSPFRFKSCDRYQGSLHFMRQSETLCSKVSDRAGCDQAAQRQFKTCGFSHNLSNSKKSRLKDLLMLVLISSSHTNTDVAMRRP